MRLPLILPAGAAVLSAPVLAQEAPGPLLERRAG
jgi:hypothetical protein